MKLAPIFLTLSLIGAHAETTGWLNWRGPLQTGVSLEKGLPEKVDPGSELWTYDIQGAGTPTIADGRLYAFGFYGEAFGKKGEDVQEALTWSIEQIETIDEDLMRRRSEDTIQMSQALYKVLCVKANAEKTKLFFNQNLTRKRWQQ